MSVCLITGLPGHGKSYLATHILLVYLARGGIVGTSVPVYREEIRKRLRVAYGWEMGDGQLIELTREQSLRFWEHIPRGTKEAPSMAMIDEAGRKWNARDWGDTSRNQRELLDLLALSRHEHLDVYFMDQAAGNVDKQFRRLAEWEYTVRNLQPWIGLPITLVRKLDPMGESVSTFILYRNSSVWSCYNSYNEEVKFDRAESVGPMGKKRKGGVMGGVKWLFIVAIVLGGVAVFRRVGREEEAPQAEEQKSRSALWERPEAADEVPVESGDAESDHELLQAVMPLLPRGLREISVNPRILTGDREGYFQGPLGRVLVLDGVILEQGRTCEYGIVQAVSPDVATVRGFDGKTVFLVPSGSYLSRRALALAEMARRVRAAEDAAKAFAASQAAMAVPVQMGPPAGVPQAQMAPVVKSPRVLDVPGENISVL